MSAALHAQAIAAAIKAANPKARALTPGQAATFSGDHIILFITRRYVPERTAGDVVAAPGWRVLTRYIAATFDNWDVLQTATKDALEGQILTLDDGSTIGPFDFETADAAELDSGKWSGDDAWTY